MAPERTVIVFGREPEASRVKTRLAAAVGEDAALAVYVELLEHSIRTAAAVEANAVLFLAERRVREWTPRTGIAIRTQCGGDLGERMHAAFEERFAAGDDQVVLIGSDCPTIGSRHLELAFAHLLGHETVLGPASDGGYWLLGQRAPGRDVFTGIPWSSPSTLEATRGRLTARGLLWSELETMRDLDTVEDLRWHVEHGNATKSLQAAMKRALGR